jgi:uncharacterized protein YhaN
MRIKRLDIKAFGHFTDMPLDFSSALPGLHIIFGPNEAGKSTALRALRGLLYGIDTRTPDNFIHDYSRLLIGGHIETSTGKELIFWRRKRNVGDLLDAQMAVLDAGVLTDFLQGVGDSLFDSLFGINHDTLVSGGRDILEQKGDVGQALFSAGAGLASLHGIIESLDSEGSELFKAGGSKPELNKAAKSFQDIKKEIRDLSLSSQTWKEQETLFESTSAALGKAEHDRNYCLMELERLKRAKRATSDLSRKRALLDKIKSLGSMDHLPGGFLEQLSEIHDKTEDATEKLKDAISRKETIEQKRSLCSVRQEILDQAESIEGLHQRLGARLQAQKDCPGLHEQMICCKTEGTTLLNQVVPGLNLTQVDEIRSLFGKRQEILKLGNKYAGLRERLRQTEKQLKGFDNGIRKTNRELEAIPPHRDISGLATAVASARKAGDLNSLLRTLELDIKMQHSSVETEVKQLMPFPGCVEVILSLALPSFETVNKFADDLRDAHYAVEKATESQQQLQDELDRVNTDIRAIEKAGTVPAEKELIQLRSKRDQGWQLVRRSWLEKEDIREELRSLGEGKELPEFYEDTVISTDEISDRLRSEAERVHKYATLSAQAEKFEEQLQRSKEAENEADQRLSQFETLWIETWKGCNIRPLSPTEMRDWLEKCQEIRRLLLDEKYKEEQRQSLIDQIQGLSGTLVAELKELGKGKKIQRDNLEPTLNYAEQVLKEFKDNNDRRQSLEDKERELQGEAEIARNELQVSQQVMAEWLSQWKNVLEGLGMAEETSPEDAADALEKMSRCLEQIDKAQGFEQRLKAIDQYQLEFSNDVADIIQAVAPELNELSPEQAVVKLQVLLTEARKAMSLMEKLTEDLETTEEDIRQANVALELATEKRKEIRKLAQCDDDKQLNDIEVKFQELVAAKLELGQIEQALTGIAEGVPIEELERQSLEIDPNGLPGEIDALDRRLKDELEPLIRDLSEQKGAARNELQRMDGSSKAAEKEEEAQQVLAKVRRLAENYVRLRIAAQVLKKEVDRYRQENQDPILKIASRYFSELTIGAFPGLRADVDDNGQPILVGVCPGERLKTVKEMSSGTRDQLYLALRLATLEWRLEKHEPMPFIADDILVNFDDARAKATLKALATLAEKNQVILFTHHAQIIETAKALGLNDRVFVHPLNTTTV